MAGSTYAEDSTMVMVPPVVQRIMWAGVGAVLAVYSVSAVLGGDPWYGLFLVPAALVIAEGLLARVVVDPGAGKVTVRRVRSVTAPLDEVLAVEVPRRGPCRLVVEDRISGRERRVGTSLWASRPREKHSGAQDRLAEALGGVPVWSTSPYVRSEDRRERDPELDAKLNFGWPTNADAVTTWVLTASLAAMACLLLYTVVVWLL